MSHLDNTVVRRGYLTVHRNATGRFSISTLISKRYWMVLCREGPGSTPGRSRIEWYRSEDRARDYQPVKVIDLDTIRSVNPVERKKGFMVDLLEDSMLFQCTSKADMEDWVRDINRFRQGVDNASGQNLMDAPHGHDVYEAIPDDETFRVKLRKTNTLRYSGPCLLEILRDFDRNLFHIALFTEDEPPRLIVKWQIDHIRQYGSNQMAFKFQSGSKSSTGVDWFIVDTEHGAAVRIHRAVDYWAKHIVDQIKNTTHGGRPRAVTGPTPARPSRPPGPTPQPWNNKEYMPLNVQGQVQPGVYQDLDSAKGSKPGKAQKSKASPEDRDRVYQPLQATQEAPSTYQTIGPRPQPPRGSANPPNPTSPGSEGSLYMGLSPDTRKPVRETTYMTPDARKS